MFFNWYKCIYSDYGGGIIAVLYSIYYIRLSLCAVSMFECLCRMCALLYCPFPALSLSLIPPLPFPLLPSLPPLFPPFFLSFVPLPSQNIPTSTRQQPPSYTQASKSSGLTSSTSQSRPANSLVSRQYMYLTQSFLCGYVQYYISSIILGLILCLKY